MTQLMTANREWATRPDDERFVDLQSLRNAVARRREESWTATPSIGRVSVVPHQGDIGVKLYDPTKGEERVLEPSNWSFNQLAQYASAPAAYLRTLPPELVAINLQYGLEHNPLRPEALVLAQSNGRNTLRAMTSVSYGRIWDLQVVDAVTRINQDDRWKVPSASYAAKNPKRATTLYASDRDVFLFLVDPSHPIEVNGEELFRGFITWNSETGSATFGLTTFLYRYVCDNRIIWGATNVQELRIVHRGGAPDRFAYEGARYLKRFSEETTTELVSGIKRAQALELPEARKKDTFVEWLQKRGLTKSQATASIQTAEQEEGQARSLWDIVNGITAYARSIPHTNERVELESKAGRLMEMVK